MTRLLLGGLGWDAKNWRDPGSIGSRKDTWNLSESLWPRLRGAAIPTCWWKGSVHQKVPEPSWGKWSPSGSKGQTFPDRGPGENSSLSPPIFHITAFDYPYYEMWVLLCNFLWSPMQRTWGAQPSKPWHVLWAASFAAAVMAAPINISALWRHRSAFWLFVFPEEPEKVPAVEGLDVVVKNTQSEPSSLCQPVKSRLLPMTCPLTPVPALIELSGTSTMKRMVHPPFLSLFPAESFLLQFSVYVIAQSCSYFFSCCGPFYPWSKNGGLIWAWIYSFIIPLQLRIQGLLYWKYSLNTGSKHDSKPSAGQHLSRVLGLREVTWHVSWRLRQGQWTKGRKRYGGEVLHSRDRKTPAC